MSVFREQLIRRALLAMSEVDQSSRGEAEARLCAEAAVDASAAPEMAELATRLAGAPCSIHDEGTCTPDEDFMPCPSCQARAILSRIKGDEG